MITAFVEDAVDAPHLPDHTGIDHFGLKTGHGHAVVVFGNLQLDVVAGSGLDHHVGHGASYGDRRLDDNVDAGIRQVAADGMVRIAGHDHVDDIQLFALHEIAYAGVGVDAVLSGNFAQDLSILIADSDEFEHVLEFWVDWQVRTAAAAAQTDQGQLQFAWHRLRFLCRCRFNALCAREVNRSRSSARYCRRAGCGRSTARAGSDRSAQQLCCCRRW